MDGYTAADIAGMLDLAAADGASSGALSTLDEAALAFRVHPGVEPARQVFSAARLAYQRNGSAGWPAVASTALALASVLRPLNSLRVPEGFNT